MNNGFEGILEDMRFPSVPTETKSQIKKAGRRMFDKSRSASERAEALDLVDRFRASHAYPINTFQSTLHKKLEDFAGSFMAQRLKRMPSIIRKLRREKTMQISTMQDIGGLRAVVNSVSDVYRLERKYSLARRFQHISKNTVDYIAQPRNSGYRGLHLIYEYRNKKHPRYNGLLLELQIRTKLQHSWATAVEIMEVLVKQPLKSSRGSQEWLDFFALTASAFAHLEGKAPIPLYSKLTKDQTFALVKEAEQKLNVRSVMKTLPLIVNYVKEQPQATQYHLVEQNFDKNEVTVRSYSRESLKQATKDYALAEARSQEANMNVVLVSADDLPTAYPNLFLQSEDFLKNLNQVLEQVK